MKIEEITTFRKGVKGVGNYVLTNEDDKKIYYEHYTCLPPPLFMLLVSVAEVCTLYILWYLASC